MRPTLTIAIPTIGRVGLRHTLDSIARQALLPGDRVLVVLDTYQEPPRPDVAALVESYGRPFELWCHNGGVHFMGNPQLNLAIGECTTDYFCAISDDDIYVDGAIARLRRKFKPGRAVLFQFYAPPYLVANDPQRFVLWADRQLRVANISGCCIASPREALVPVRPDLRIEVDYEWIVDMVAKTGQKPLWMNDVLIIARPNLRDGEPVHLGVSRCLGCGWRGFEEDMTDRLCVDCAPTVIRELMLSA